MVLLLYVSNVKDTDRMALANVTQAALLKFY